MITPQGELCGVIFIMAQCSFIMVQCTFYNAAVLFIGCYLKWRRYSVKRVGIYLRAAFKGQKRYGVFS